MVKMAYYLIFLLLLLNAVVVLGNDKDTGSTRSNQEIDNFLQQIEEDGEGTAETNMDQVPITDNSEADLKPGDTVSNGGETVEGKNPDTIVRKDNNKVKGKQKTHSTQDGLQVEYADQVTTSQGAKANGVKDGNVYSNGYYDFGSVNSLIDGPFKVLNGENVKHDSTGFSVGSGENVQQEGVMSGQVSDYSGDDNSFNVGSADSVFFEKSRFDNIKDSSFKVDDGKLAEANVTSTVDNNTVKAGDIEITLNKNDNVKVVKNPTGKYDVHLNPAKEGNDTHPRVTVDDSYGSVACINLASTTRYKYTGEDYDAFGVYIPSNADNFNLCIRTESEEQYPTNCSQCGVMDFYNKNFTLNGNYEYEKRNKVDPRLFTDIIKANGNFSGNLSEDGKYITNLCPGYGHVYTGAFEVKFDDMVGFRYYDNTKPYTVKHIHKNTTIKNKILNHQNPTNSLTMFSEKADGFWAGFNRRIY